ncbi:MAG: hypothetical protein LUQ09_04025 [Methanomassiliicoccales archaeon]|nr:hypothetical protein [Methanomassiliicoccales archaeon]
MPRLPRISRNVPARFRKLYGTKISPGTNEMLRTEGRTMEDVYADGYNIFLWSIILLVPIAGLMSFLLPYPYSLVSVSAALVVLMLPSYIISAPSSRFKAEQRSYLLDSPAVVGAITMSMNRSPSLERALEVGSRSGNGRLQSSLSLVVWKALTGEVHDLRRGISAWTANLDATNDGMRRSMHLIMAAEEEPGNEGRDRLLDRANSLVLEGLREACERYVASLSFPVMLVFAFGVLAPVMLFSLIPLMSMDIGLTGDGSYDVMSLAAILLVLVPVSTFLYMRSLMGRNPLCRPVKEKGKMEKRQWALIIMAVPAAVAAWTVSGSAVISTMAGLAILLLSLFISGSRESKDDAERSRSFVDGLYRFGNGMLRGQDLETAFEDAVLTENGEFRRWGLKMVHLTRTARTPLVDAVRDDEELMRWSPVLHQAYITVMECAQEDHRGAGKVAINLAQCQNDLDRTKRRIREGLRSVMDMMNTTSLIFAPVIIGLTSGIMGLLGGEKDWLMVVASIYVVELAILVNYFTKNLDGWRDPQKGWRAYGARGAIALAAFLTASLCGQMFLFRLL